jgi:dTDP-4-dehydrorhamnose reductase
VSVILLTGKNGQVGWELRRSLLPLGRVVAVDRHELDLADADALRHRLSELRPDIIVNAAAYTAVDQAEREPALAHAVNAAAPAQLAEDAARRGALLIHYSTDYVFDGTKGEPYDEDDRPNPLNAYGRSKLDGEEAVQASGAGHLILRTSWLYSSRGSNFLRTMLRLASEREELRIVADQIGTPTWARFLAESTAQAVRQAMQERRSGNFESGVFHLTAVGETSWHGFASAILERAASLPGAPGFRVKAVTPIATAEYPLPAARPANSRLRTDRFRARFGLEIPSWEECLQLCLEEIRR